MRDNTSAKPNFINSFYSVFCMSKQELFKELIDILKKKKLSKEKLVKLKAKLCKKHGVREIPKDIQILLNAEPEEMEGIELVSKPTRTISGVAIIAIMSKPFKCPHGKCLMCPGGPASVFGNVPQSYTGKEPATMRAIRNNFDSYLQVMNRLEHYVVQGHSPEKAELIVMGGTFPSFPKGYQDEFVMYAFKAMNDFSVMFYKKGRFDALKFKKFFELPGDVKDEKRTKIIHAKLLKLKEKSNLVKEQLWNEKSRIRCVGLTLETRADFAKLKQANEMLRLGCTRVEVGVQSVYDKALNAIKRGHGVEDTIESFRVLKDLGFKINAHYMLGLPGVSYKEDLAGLRRLFADPDFRPDMLKLYPCMVMKGTGLYRMWKKGKYKPLTTSRAAEMIADFKKHVPPYVRIMRVQRDIPTYATAAGVDRTNLRQYVEDVMRKKKIKCSCIRCREIGRAKRVGKARLKVLYYTASEGDEFFISVEDKENIFGFCRLRFPSQSLLKEITDDSALIRELHVYGPATAIGKRGIVQHKGIGKMLLHQAEDIAKTYYKNKMVVISGIGARDYYRKMGYKKEGAYMVKRL